MAAGNSMNWGAPALNFQNSDLTFSDINNST